MAVLALSGVGQTAGVNTMRKMLEMWGDSAVVIHLDLTTGNYIEGLVKEVDRDEVVVEPVYEDGSVGALTVINLNHVVMAYYDETPPDFIDDPVTEAVIADDGTVTT